MPDPPDSNSPVTSVIELQSVDSTNNYARLLIERGRLREFSSGPEPGSNDLLNGVLIFAHEQHAGKGQRGKNWVSEKDANILMSVIIRPTLTLADQFKLLACVAVSAHEFFTNYAESNVYIKWPNDLYWNDRKAGGILIETIITRNENDDPVWNWAIIGIGININQAQFPPSIPNAVSLKQITGKDYAPIDLARELYGLLQNRYRQLANEGFDKIYAYYLSHLYKRGHKVKLKKGAQVFEALIKGVSIHGNLVAQHGIEEEYRFGAVEWL